MTSKNPGIRIIHVGLTGTQMHLNLSWPFEAKVNSLSTENLGSTIVNAGGRGLGVCAPTLNKVCAQVWGEVSVCYEGI